MKKYCIIPVFIFLLVISFPGYSQGKIPKDAFFFIQMTDPQFGFIENNKGFEKETALFEKAVREVNRLKPSFVVITGDLVNNKDDKAQINEFKRITALINPEIPVYYTPGNHDIGQTPVAKDIDDFIKNYGYDRFSFIYKKNLFIGLNSCLIKSNTPVLEQNQAEWLKKELVKGKKAKHKIIFCHYSFFISRPDEPDEYFNIPPETRKKYLSIFKDNNVDAVFAGHFHNNGYGKSGEMEMITTSAVGKPLGKVPSGLRVIKVFPDLIENNYYSLDSIPEKIEMIK